MLKPPEPLMAIFEAIIELLNIRLLSVALIPTPATFCAVFPVIVKSRSVTAPVELRMRRPP